MNINNLQNILRDIIFELWKIPRALLIFQKYKKCIFLFM